MTVQEFSNEFDVQYNNIAKSSAPPIDLYEKSVYLTKAQLELVNNHFNPLGNKYKDGFEQSSKRRADLRELIRTGISSTQIFSDKGIDPNSKFFRIQSNTYLIIQEKVLLSSEDKCVDGTYSKVKPKTHDEYNTQIDNPFKQPNKDRTWRIDYSTQENNKNVELISPYDIREYRYRYIVLPKPIVLVDLETEFPNENLSIDGITNAQTCALGEGIHREILNRAVEMATADYDPQMLAVKTQMNLRNE